ncbi:T-cell surface antigen CD2-like isoform X1 [Anguilla anguilla]|uniref:T-cell surface antigen CD2-like isoform X1 n=1 Tax=Anguilla anguilla TaxID=7936 RepID=UPI0015AF276F|nr:T-cell surface antigen CD2-like isoform X1 [Anguilla anguilla]
MDIKSYHTICILLCLFSGESCGQTVYGKMGENVYLHLQESHGRSFPDIECWHQNILIAKTARSVNPFAEVFSNGTLKLHNVGRNCSGVYTVSAYDANGTVHLKESSHLVVIDPPVVELVACILGVSVLYCAGENGPDAVYEWRVSIQNQGGLNVSSHTGKHVTLDYSTGNISCSLIMGNYSSRSASYSLSCAGSAGLVPETQLSVSLGVTVMLVLLCFMTCGISVGVQICRKRQNSNVKSEESGCSLKMTQDDGIVYVNVGVGKRHK